MKNSDCGHKVFHVFSSCSWFPRRGAFLLFQGDPVSWNKLPDQAPMDLQGIAKNRTGRDTLETTLCPAYTFGDAVNAKRDTASAAL